VKILIADDDPLSLRLLQLTLERFGHDVEAVNNGVDAEEALVRPTGPRLAILDWMMPRADGLSVCRAVRRHIDRYVYLIVLTSLDRREDMLAALDAGVDDFLTKPFNNDELRARLRSGERVLALEERLLAVQASLQFHATHDYLTGVMNRAAIFDRLSVELTRARREGTPVSVMLADLDHFKQINDTLGHAVGDITLVRAVRRIQSAIRAYDAIGRYGGEEFLLVLPGCDRDAAMIVSERARLAVAEPEPAAGAPHVSVSIGVACTNEAGPDPQALVNAADQALYRAKASGRNRVAA
jgi:diguanylate cyclase (GGDEF)-like protein